MDPIASFTLLGFVVSADSFDQILAVSVTVSVCILILAIAVSRSSQTVRVYAFASYFLASTVGTALWIWFPDSRFPDAVYYDQSADMLWAYWRSETYVAPRITGGKEGYVFLLAGLYRLVGHAPVAGIAMTALLGTLVVPIVAATAKSFRDQADHCAAALAAFLPPVMWWKSNLLRDALVWLLTASAAHVAVRISTNGVSHKRLSLLIGSLALLATTRAATALIVGAAIGLALLITFQGRRPRDFVAITICAAVFLLVGLQYEGISRLIDLDASDIAQSRDALVRDASSSLAFDVSPMETNPWSAIRSTAAPVLLGPLPWQVGQNTSLALLEMLSWWMVFGLAIISIFRRAIPDAALRERLILLAPALGILVALMATSGNYGTMIRLRTQALVLLIPLSGVGLAYLRAEVHRRAPFASSSGGNSV